MTRRSQLLLAIILAVFAACHVAAAYKMEAVRPAGQPAMAFTGD